MKLFKKPFFKSFNKKLKRIRLKSCVPSSADQLSFDESTPSEKGVVVVRPSPVKSTTHRSPTEVRFKDPAVDPPPTISPLRLERTVSRMVGAEPPRVWRPPPIPRDDSECSEVMVLNKHMETGEFEFDPEIERSPLDEAAYRYHYTLRRIRQQDDEPTRPASPAPPDDPAAEHYSRLRENGLISTSFDEFKPLLTGEEQPGDVQRHPKLSALFNWTNGDDSHQFTTDNSSLAARDKYTRETERDSNEVFLEAGLWLDKPKTSSPRSRGRSASAPLTGGATAPRADMGFYIHNNRSADQLVCTSDSSSTEVLSPEIFSPRFTARSESVTTENGIQGLDIADGHKYDDGVLASTPPATITRISPGAPPNTPWDPASPDIQLLSRAGKESSNRRRPKIPTADLDQTYSFIAFSSPPRVALETTIDTGRLFTPRSALAKPKSTYTGFFTPRPKASAATTKRTPSAPLLTPITVGTEPSKPQLARVSPRPSAIGKAREDDFVSSFAEDLNKALDVLDSLANSHDAARILAFGSNKAGAAADAKERNEFNKSPILGSNLSRFSEELASSDTDEGGSADRFPHTASRWRARGGFRGNASRLPTQRRTRKLPGGQLGFMPNRQYRKILELYTLQYQMY